jgi:hypothetical protein
MLVHFTCPITGLEANLGHNNAFDIYPPASVWVERKLEVLQWEEERVRAKKGRSKYRCHS